jgi:hypothetical protein
MKCQTLQCDGWFVPTKAAFELKASHTPAVGRMEKSRRASCSRTVQITRTGIYYSDFFAGSMDNSPSESRPIEPPLEGPSSPAFM